MRFLEVVLAGPPSLTGFYESLGLPRDGDAIQIGETRLRFEPSGGEPFYHFALLVPGDRFDAAHVWADERVELLGDAFDFESWNARAIYFADPAGTIVELIAHRGLEEHGRTGAFAAEELVGLSELGLVGDPPALYAGLQALGLRLFDGTVDEPGRLAFVGEKGRTVILAPSGRGWLPTDRPAEPHPVKAIIEAQRQGRVNLGDELYELTSGPRAGR